MNCIWIRKREDRVLDPVHTPGQVGSGTRARAPHRRRWRGYGGRLSEVSTIVVNGYYVFEDDICVDLPNVLDGMPDYANAPLSRFVARSCVDRPEVLDGKPSYVNSPLPEFFAKARCPPILVPLGVAAVKEYG